MGTIVVGTQAVDNLAKTSAMSPHQAAKAIAIHEMGHAFYQQRTYQLQPGDNAPMSDKIAWCMQREGMATFYAFKVALESGFPYVSGTTQDPNLYGKMLAALNGINPLSNMYESKGIEFATAEFQKDGRYQLYCSDPDNWKIPSYLTPPSTSGGSWGGGVISGAGGGFWYVPEPGGYWQEVPPEHPSDSVIVPDDSLSSMLFLRVDGDDVPTVNGDSGMQTDLAYAAIIGQAIVQAESLYF